MALSKEEVLDAIADMSVMDVVQLVEAMEKNSAFRQLRLLLQHLLPLLVAMLPQLKKKTSLILSLQRQARRK
jgi:ribosomal protein L7/L12